MQPDVCNQLIELRVRILYTICRIQYINMKFYYLSPLIAIKIFHGSNVGDFLELIAIQLDTFGMRMYVVLCQHNLT